MMRFDAIEGLRGWLAWTVVLSHITYFTDVYASGIGQIMNVAGALAVYVFTIISGFVIAHLVLSKHETYRVYIVRRFMRIFPLFAVTCVLGFFCMPFMLDALLRVPWTNAHDFAARKHDFVEVVRSQIDFFWPNVLAHSTMLHGAVSDGLVPMSAYVFNYPAWSLSLEWQFYLLAPFALAVASRNANAVIAICVLTVLCIAYEFGFFGHFGTRSLLPAASEYFAVGIVSRLAYPKLARSLKRPAIAMALILGAIPLGQELTPFVIWGCVYVILITDRCALAAVDTVTIKVASAVLESPLALFMGKRSYSIYLCHASVLGLVFYALTVLVNNLSSARAFTALLFIVVPLTSGLSVLLYGIVEKPGIALGNMVARRMASTELDTLPVVSLQSG